MIVVRIVFHNQMVNIERKIGGSEGGRKERNDKGSERKKKGRRGKDFVKVKKEVRKGEKGKRYRTRNSENS